MSDLTEKEVVAIQTVAMYVFLDRLKREGVLPPTAPGEYYDQLPEERKPIIARYVEEEKGLLESIKRQLSGEE